MIDRRIVFKVVLEVELHVDSRVDETTLEWVVSDWFRSSDGREPFSVEMMQVGFGKAAKVIAERLQDSVAQRLSDRLPRSDEPWQRTRKLRTLLGDPKVGYHVQLNAFADAVHVVQDDYLTHYAEPPSKDSALEDGERVPEDA